MKTLKSILKVIAGLIVLLAFILTGAENPDGSLNLGWSLGCIAVAFLSFKVAEWCDAPAKK